jgi:hypothetical protein
LVGVVLSHAHIPDAVVAEMEHDTIWSASDYHAEPPVAEECARKKVHRRSIALDGVGLRPRKRINVHGTPRCVEFVVFGHHTGCPIVARNTPPSGALYGSVVLLELLDAAEPKLFDRAFASLHGLGDLRKRQIIAVAQQQHLLLLGIELCEHLL